MNTLQIDSINKSFGDKNILNDIFLSCVKGKITGLIGRNGCGKSTLLKIIFGIEKTENKFIFAGDKKINNVSDSRGLINYLPQENFLPNNVKIKTLINLFLDKKNRSVLIENIYIRPLLNKQNQELSGGEKRILEILLIIHSNAEFILLDEPFNGVSPIIKDYIINYLKEMKSLKGYIITDHDYENVINLADNIVFLKDGSLKEIKHPSELVELGYLTKNYLQQHL
jgi:ABC-type multidrug transport system ATPase subunit